MPALTSHSRVGGLALLFAILLAFPLAASEPIVLADFESETYGDWVTTGTAFGEGPARGTLAGQMPVSGYLGQGLVNSFREGDGSTGTLESPEFVIDRDHVHFLVGGGGFADQTCVQLLVDGKVVRSATGPNQEAGGSEHLRPYRWDVLDLKGRTARIRIVDEATGGWGHINVDHIVLADADFAWPDQRDDLLARAEKSVADATARAAEDPARPAFHFRPPANWMNDPNGTIYINGYYHVFYQFNPYGDAWGNMHWGHARSRDLVNWETLPIALWPSRAAGEDHVFSGAAAVDGEGKPVLFYTSVGAGRPNEQWASLPNDRELLQWRKFPGNPLMTTRLPDGTVLGDGMRDPFPFRVGDRTFLVVGADTRDESVIPLYEAADPSLLRWDFKGMLWRCPKSVMEFPECPNFFPLGDRFVLLTSPYRPVEYRVGSFDLESGQFTPETEGRLDPSDQFYATNIATAPNGDCILFGWVRGFPAGKGWNGCLALPRVLTLGPDGRPRQHPIPTLEKLRGPVVSAREIELLDSARALEGVAVDQLEVQVRFRRGPFGRIGLRLGRAGAAEIVWDGNDLEVAGLKVPLPKPDNEDQLELHLFLDRSVLEVFTADGALAVTRVIPYRLDGAPLLEVFAAGGIAQVEELSAWPLDGVWPEPETRD